MFNSQTKIMSKNSSSIWKRRKLSSPTTITTNRIQNGFESPEEVGRFDVRKRRENLVEFFEGHSEFKRHCFRKLPGGRDPAFFVTEHVVKPSNGGPVHGENGQLFRAERGGGQIDEIAKVGAQRRAKSGVFLAIASNGGHVHLRW